MKVLEKHVQNGEIAIAKSKINDFVALRSSSSFQKLKKNLEMFNWLINHLSWTAEITASLQQLYHFEHWKWTTNHENAFRLIKQMINEFEVFKFLNFEKSVQSIIVITNASLIESNEYIAQKITLKIAKLAVYHFRVCC